MASGAQAKVKAGWKLWGVVLAVFCASLFGAWWALKQRFDVNHAPAVYDFVARFEREGVPGIEEGTFRLKDVKSPVVIVNFWASWCGPCVEEFPSMLKLVEAMKGKVTVVAVSQDEDEKDLQAFTKLFKVPRPNFIIVKDPGRRVSGDYGVGKLPESFIVGPDRKLVRKVLGIEDWATPNAIEYFNGLASAAK